MAGFDKVKSMADRLWKEPSTRNWEAFRKALVASKVKYYRTVYAGKLKRLDDLKRAQVLLYDSGYKLVTRVPAYKTAPRGPIEGALWYVRGLDNTNIVVE